ncbi:MAG: SDR family oxidoreductase [Aureispira sp.]|nr:SDR family oxidoreductase [Aureispira sp.]
MSKIMVVTGANSGIGKETALALAQQGNRVVMVCRNPEKGATAQEEIKKQSKNNKIDLLLCDFSSQESIKTFGENFRSSYDSIDVLVNNAGAIFGDKKTTVDGIERTFGVNHLGYFLITHELLDLIKKGRDKRIVSVSSLVHNLVKVLDYDNLQGEKTYGQMANYGLSKLLNIYFTKVLSKQMQEQQTGVTVNCLHPGSVNTNFGSSGSKFFRRLFKIGGPLVLTTPKKGAKTSVYLALSPDVKGITGEYFAKSRIKKTSKLAQDMEHAHRIWDLSKELTGVESFGKLS